MEVKSTRKQVRVCNCLIMLLCLVSILAYFVMPFWKVSVKMQLTAETVQELIPLPEEGEGETGDMDISSLLGDEELPTIELSIALKTTDIISSVSEDPEKVVESILTENINTLVSELEPLINKAAKSMLKTTAKETFSAELKNRVKDKLGEGATDSEIQNELNAMSLTDEYLDTKTEELIDHIYEDGATVDSTVQKTVDIVEESIEKMKENEGYQDVTFSEEDKNELREDLTEMFSQFANEDGTLDPETFTSELLLGLLGETENSGETGATYANPLSVKATADGSEPETEEDAQAQLRTLLTEKIMGALGDATEMIVMVIQYVSYVLFFTFFTWAYLILKILVKWKRVNNAIKLKLPIWLGSLPYVLLCLAPTIALKALGDMLPLPSALTLSFTSAGLVSFIIGVCFIFFSLFYYGKRRRFLKRAAKRGYVLDQEVSSEETPAEE